MKKLNIILFIKIALFSLLPLGADEAYYWIWSKHLQLGYFDHPPMISWILSLGSEQSYLLTRLPVIIVSILSLFVIYKICQRLNINDKNNLLICCSVSPLLGFGAFIATPDVVVILFYLLSFFFLTKILDERDWKNYAYFGASLGLGFLSKYHIVVFPLTALIYLTFERQWSKINLRYVAITVFFGLIFCSPVLIWNYQHDWASFTFQLKHGLAKGQWRSSWTWSYLIGQVFLLSPILVFIFHKSTLKILKYFTIIPLVFFFMTSFKGLVEANWPIIAYPFFYMTIYSVAGFETLKKVNLYFWIAIYSSLVLVGISSFDKLPDKLKEPFILKQAVGQISDYSPMYGGSYQIASSLWYFGGRPVYKLYDISRFDFFDTLKESKPKSAQFYLFAHEETNIPEWVRAEGYNQSVLEQIGHYKVYQFNK